MASTVATMTNTVLQHSSPFSNFASQPQSLREFHLFGFLPPELRDYIWELAGPDPRAPGGVHVFSARLGAQRPHQQQLVPIGKGRGKGLDEAAEAPPNLQLFTLAIPASSEEARRRRQRRRRRGWLANRNKGAVEEEEQDNFSSYLQNSALWFACHESRAAMQRLYKGCDVVPFTLPTDDEAAINNNEAGAPPRSYVLNRGTDLMLVRPRDLGHGRPPLDQTVRCASFIHMPAFLPTPGRGGIRVAVEYSPDDPACAGGRWGFFAESLLDAVHEVARVEGGRGEFLLVDRTLRLRDGVSEADLGAAGRRPDFECEGRRYYRVESSSGEREVGEVQGDAHFESVSSPLATTQPALATAPSLQQQPQHPELTTLRNDWDALTAKNLFVRPGISKGHLQASVGVLACVRDDGRASSSSSSSSWGQPGGDKGGSCVVQ